MNEVSEDQRFVITMKRKDKARTWSTGVNHVLVGVQSPHAEAEKL
jgi:hypothetical protein